MYLYDISTLIFRLVVQTQQITLMISMLLCIGNMPSESNGNQGGEDRDLWFTARIAKN
jgi:hypothetical protein